MGLFFQKERQTNGAKYRVILKVTLKYEQDEDSLLNRTLTLNIKSDLHSPKWVLKGQFALPFSCSPGLTHLVLMKGWLAGAPAECDDTLRGLFSLLKQLCWSSITPKTCRTSLRTIESSISGPVKVQTQIQFKICYKARKLNVHKNTPPSLTNLEIFLKNGDKACLYMCRPCRDIPQNISTVTAGRGGYIKYLVMGGNLYMC